jgi:hypothetical protein
VIDPRHAELVSQVAPAGCKIFSGSAGEMSKLLGAHPGVKLGLVDGALTKDLSALFEGLGVNTVYYIQRMRRKLPHVRMRPYTSIPLASGCCAQSDGGPASFSASWATLLVVTPTAPSAPLWPTTHRSSSLEPS